MNDVVNTTNLPDNTVDTLKGKDISTFVVPVEETQEKRGTSSLSPEIFIPNDNIVTTQASQLVENDGPESVIIHDEDDSTKVSQQKMVTHQDDDDQLADGRRRSERLKKDNNMTTMEKTDRMVQKRNLEGNSKKPVPISVLPVDEIMNISANMGVTINSENFDTFDLIKDLARARDDLYSKQVENKLKSQTESVEISKNHVGLPELEWLETETYEPEDLILVESRKEKRENKKARIFSPLIRKKVDQEDPGQPKKRGRPCKANPTKNSKTRKNDKSQWFNMEL
jgi:hypothetical protein